MLFGVSGFTGGVGVVFGVTALLSNLSGGEGETTARLSGLTLGVAFVAAGAAFVIKSRSKKAEKPATAKISITPNGAALSIQY